MFYLYYVYAADIRSTLSNTVEFYKQFIPVIETTLCQSTTPIEKEFKVRDHLLIGTNADVHA